MAGPPVLLHLASSAQVGQVCLSRIRGGQSKRQVCGAYLAVLSWGLTEVLPCGPLVGGCTG